MSARRYVLALLLFSLAACSHNEGAESAKRTVLGSMTKGPVSGASIELFVFDDGGNPVGDPVASAVSDSNGRFSFTDIPPGSPYLVVSSGGRFVDESDKFAERDISLAANQGLESILPAEALQVAINPYTQALVDKIRAEADTNSFLSLLSSARQLFSDAFGFDVLVSLPSSPTAPSGSRLEKDYAMALGGAAVAIGAIDAQAGSTRMSYQAIRAFSADFSDGALDGQSFGTPLLVNGQAVAAGDINREIARFRNNNDAAYAGLPPLTLDLASVAAPAVPDADANRVPSALDDSYSLDEGVSLNIAAPGVLSNDFDPDGDTLSVTLVSGPAQAASFALNADGSFDYTHNGSETSSDSFSYRANDAQAASETATVTLSVSLVNDPPTLETNTGVTVVSTQSVAVTSSELSATDADSPSADLVYTVTSPSSCGSFQLSGSNVLSFGQDDLVANTVGFDASDCPRAGSNLSVPMELSDGADSISFNFAVTVTQAPNAAPSAVDDSYSLDEGAVLNVATPGVLANDTDLDGDTLSATLVTDPVNASSFSLEDDGSFIYKHNGSETSSDSFTYLAEDGQAQSSAVTVSLSINPLNDAPQLVQNRTVFVDSGLSVSISNAELQATDSDHAAGDVSFTVSSPPLCGAFEISATPAASFTQAQIDAGLLTFNASGCAQDQDVVSGLNLTDAAGGGPIAFSYTVTINGPVNQPPTNTLPSETISTSSGTATVLSGISVLDPDADAAGDTLTFNFTVSQGLLSFRTDVAAGLVAADFAGTNNSAAVVVNATLDRLNATLADASGLTYTSDADYFGPDAMQLTSNDNGNNGTGGAKTDIDSLSLAVRRLPTEAPAAGLQLNLLGNTEGRRTGDRVTGIGDFNGDGFDDVLIAEGKDGGEFAYVVFGQSPVPVSSENVRDIGTPAATLSGFVINYGDDGSRFGRGVAGGDLNNDGFDDLMISAEREDGESGPVYILFGTPTPPTVFDINSLNGSNGFVVESNLDDIHLGSDLAFADDINGDGVGDLVIGAHHGSPSDRDKAGMVFVLFGSATGFPANFDLGDLDGNNGVRLDGALDDERAGDRVAVVDIDGDSLMDVVLGAPRAEPGATSEGGKIYIVFGSTIATGSASIDLATLSVGQGVIIAGESDNSNLGKAIAGGSDLNGDGLDDLLFGSRSGSGSAYVLYGAPALPLTVLPSSLNGTNGFRIVNSDSEVVSFGRAVAAGGDFNGDAQPDIVITDTLASPIVDGVQRDGAGEAYILFGRSLADPAFPVSYDVAGDDGSNVLWLPGVSKDGLFGESAFFAGDFDANGRADILIGAPTVKLAGKSYVGVVYLFFGR